MVREELSKGIPELYEGPCAEYLPMSAGGARRVTLIISVECPERRFFSPPHRMIYFIVGTACLPVLRYCHVHLIDSYLAWSNTSASCERHRRFVGGHRLVTDFKTLLTCH